MLRGRDLPAVGRTRPARSDRGSVTVEAALALCALVVVLALAIGGLLAVAAQLRCVDAAREAARLTARGETERGRLAAVRLAPHGATVQIVVEGDEVSARVGVVPVGGLLPGLQIAAESVGVLEPAGPEPAGPEPAGPEPAGPEPAGPEPAGPDPRLGVDHPAVSSP